VKRGNAATAAIALSLLCVGLPLAAEGNDDLDAWLQAFAPLADDNGGLTQFPVLGIPPGGKYEGMGTAYAAIADHSAFVEANPAGSGNIVGSELAILHHAWIADSAIDTLTFHTVLAQVPGLALGGGAKLLYSGFTAYGPLGERVASGFFGEGVVTINTSYRIVDLENFFLAAGINAQLAVRAVPESLMPGQSAVGVPFDLGLLARTRLLDFSATGDHNLAFGLVVHDLGPYAAGYPLPTRFTLGMAYTPIAPLTVAVDVTLPITFDAELFPAQRASVAVGVDVAITPFFAAYAGINLKADNPRISLGAEVDYQGVSYAVNYNIDAVGGLNPFNTYSLEVRIGLGADGGDG
jgi:hypothetical protein